MYVFFNYLTLKINLTSVCDLLFVIVNVDCDLLMEGRSNNEISLFKCSCSAITKISELFLDILRYCSVFHYVRTEAVFYNLSPSPVLIGIPRNTKWRVVRVC